MGLTAQNASEGADEIDDDIGSGAAGVAVVAGATAMTRRRRRTRNAKKVPHKTWLPYTRLVVMFALPFVLAIAFFTFNLVTVVNTIDKVGGSG